MKLRDMFERKVFGWALYDWANSAFATTVIAGFFPIFLREYWSAGEDSATITFRLALATSAASIATIILGPVLGAVADCSGNKKKFLILFAFIGVLSTLCLFTVAQGGWQMALVFFALGSFGFATGNVFYDALLVDVAPDAKRIHVASCLGYGLGYLGGGLLFLVNVLMVLNPQSFGLADSGVAIRVSFLMVGIWWALFSIPIMLFVKDVPAEKERSRNAFIAGIREVVDTVRLVKGKKTIILFLVAYWFYIDGVGTIFRMAVDYGLSIGLNQNDLIGALLLVQFIGFPAALAFGVLGQRFGPKFGIYCGIVVYVIATVWGYFITTGTEFYILAAMVGLVQGGIQALSRSLYAQIIPQNQVGQYFGIFNMIGKAAAIIGPVLIGWSAMAFGHRNSILSVIVLFVIGGVALYYVKAPQGERSRFEA